MFVGHYAVALASKKAAPRVSFGTLLLAAQFPDLLWPAFLLLNLEHVRIAPGNTAFTPLNFYDYPITHSLLTAILWGTGFAGVYFLLKRARRSALVLFMCVVSHWVLDFITHRPDMPLVPGAKHYVGLGLWNSIPATLVVELSMFLAGVLIFLSVSKAKDRTGQIAFWSFIASTLFLYMGNVFGATPPNVRTLAWFGLSQWMVIPWAYWIDRHRTLQRATVSRSQSV